jgi:hypothetical protein
VATRLKSVGQAGNFRDVVQQGRENWYNEDTQTVTFDDAITPLGCDAIQRAPVAGVRDELRRNDVGMDVDRHDATRI